jgi:cell division protein FtsQ
MKIAIKRGGKTRAAADDPVVGARRTSVGSAVLDAPEEAHAPEWERSTPWPGGGPAPAGALQRGFGGPQDDTSEVHNDSHEEEYIPRRGGARAGLRGLSRSVGGRVLLGSAVALVLGMVVLVVAGARSFLLHDDRFMIASSSQIEMEGNVHLTRDELLSVFAGDLERNIFRVSLAERRADLERLPWVEHATVMRLLPNRLRVQITERTPVAFVRQGTQIGLVDATGVLLDMPAESAGDPRYTFPVLTGIVASDPPEARRQRMDVYERFLHELDSTGEHLSNQLSEVDVSNPEDVKALVTTDGSDVLVHFGEGQFLQRFHAFQQHLPEWRQQYPKLAAADMRYEGQVVLEMQKGEGVPTPTPAAPVAAAPPVSKPVAVKPAAPRATAVKPSAAKPTAGATARAARRIPAHSAVSKSAAAKARERALAHARLMHLRAEAAQSSTGGAR